MKPREPFLEVPGPFAVHDQRCAVLAGESAVYQLWDGVFAPSWKAQAEGWRLIQARTWLQRLALRLVFKPSSTHSTGEST